MSKARFQYILSLMDDIDYIITKHAGITNALQDIEGKHALLMCLMQIGETLNKIDKTQYPTLNTAIKGAYDVRNFIAHDYEGINIAIIENILRNLLKPLRDEIISVM